MFGYQGHGVKVKVKQTFRAITFEHLNLGTLFLVCRYILIISRSCLGIKVMGSRSRLKVKVYFFLWPITFEQIELWASFLVCRYIFIISRSSSSTKVMGSRSRSMVKA